MLIRKVIILILATTLTGQAQFSKSLEISSSYDDNLFRSPEADDDVLTDILLNLSYIPEIFSFIRIITYEIFLCMRLALIMLFHSPVTAITCTWEQTIHYGSMAMIIIIMIITSFMLMRIYALILVPYS